MLPPSTSSRATWRSGGKLPLSCILVSLIGCIVCVVLLTWLNLASSRWIADSNKLLAHDAAIATLAALAKSWDEEKQKLNAQLASARGNLAALSALQDRFAVVERKMEAADLRLEGRLDAEASESVKARSDFEARVVQAERTLRGEMTSFAKTVPVPLPVPVPPEPAVVLEERFAPLSTQATPPLEQPSVDLKLTPAQVEFRALLASRSVQMKNSLERGVVMGMVTHTATYGDGGFNFATSWMDQWVCAVTYAGLGDNYILVAMDATAVATAKARGYPVVHGPDVLTKVTFGDLTLRTWVDYTLAKPFFVLEGISLGYGVLWSDLDVVFAKNVLSEFDSEPEWDAAFSPEDNVVPNTGLYYVRPTPASKQVVRAWTDVCKRGIYIGNHEGGIGVQHDQNYLASMPGLAWRKRIWPMNIMSNGCSVLGSNSVDMVGRRVSLHLNCMWEPQIKVDFAKKINIWLVNEEGKCIGDPGWSKGTESPSKL